MGGFPWVVLEEDETIKEKLLSEYLDMVVYKDVVERYGVRNLHVMKLLIRSLMHSFSKEFSVHAFYNSLKSRGMSVSKGVLYEYLGYLEDSMSVFLLKKSAIRLKDPGDLRSGELEGLKRAGDKLRVERRMVITWDYRDERDGIEFIPLWEYLQNL